MSVDEFTADLTRWTVVGPVTKIATPAPGYSQTAFRFGVNTQVVGTKVPIDRNAQYLVRCDYDRTANPNGTFYLGVALYRADGSHITGDGSYWLYKHAINGEASTEGTPDHVYRFFGAGTAREIPADAVAMAPLALGNYGGTQGFHIADGVRIEKLSSPADWQNDHAENDSVYSGQMIIAPGVVRSHGYLDTRWTRAARTKRKFDSVRISCKAFSLATHQMLGLTDQPGSSYADGAYCLYADVGVLRRYSYGGEFGDLGSYALTDTLTVEYDGGFIVFLKTAANGAVTQLYKGWVGTGRSFWGAVYMYERRDSGFHSLTIEPAGTASVIGYNTVNASGGPLGAADLVTSQGIAAGYLAQTAAGTAPDNQVFNSYVAPGQNLIPNSDQTLRQNFILRWNPDAMNMPWGLTQLAAYGYLGWSTADYEIAGNVKAATVYQSGRVSSPSFGWVEFDIDRGDGTRWRTPCSPGEVMIASAYFQTHRCLARIIITFENANGDLIDYGSAEFTSSPDGLANRLSHDVMPRLFVKRTAPAGTYSASIIVAKSNTLAGQSDSHWWCAGMMLERAAANQSGPSPYMPGPPATARQVGYLGDLNATLGAYFGGNLLEGAGGAQATLANFRTNLGIAAGFIGAGPGATAPANQVLNHTSFTNTLGYQNHHIHRLAGGYFSNTAEPAAGAIKIRLPVKTAYPMVSMVVKITEYASGGVAFYNFFGYWYPDGLAWLNVGASASANGQFARAVRFGRDSGDFPCVWIGDHSGFFSHPSVSIESVQLGYAPGSLDPWLTGWQISMDTSPATNVSASVLTPTAGDAIFGLNARETTNGAVATLANFRTNLEISGGYFGQTAAATAPDSQVFNSYLHPRTACRV